MTATITYKGDLRCECVHIQSGSIIETDAPTDNRGKGERFSPTDTLCIALGTCIITTMGIRASDMGISLKDTQIEVTKHMVSDPRRIGKIEITLHIPPVSISEKDKKVMELIGDSCPVKKSLHPDMDVEIVYKWQ